MAGIYFRYDLFIHPVLWRSYAGRFLLFKTCLSRFTAPTSRERREHLIKGGKAQKKDCTTKNGKELDRWIVNIPQQKLHMEKEFLLIPATPFLSNFVLAVILCKPVLHQ